VAIQRFRRDAEHLADPDLKQRYQDEADRLMQADQSRVSTAFQRHHNTLCWQLDIAPEYPGVGTVED
jgi:hypothetical protein